MKVLHVANSGKLPTGITHILVGRLITNVLRKDKQKIIWYNLIIRKLSVKCLFLNNWEMPKRWIIDSCYAVVLPTMATSMLPGCTHLLFPLLHAEKFPFSTFSHPTKKITDICMQAWRMSLTKTVCQTLMSLMLIDGLTLLYKIQPFQTSRQ